ncbi:MAG: hypothetical protein FWF29_12985 [Treponema sp.]|nr:hypothetical protein [Treponema sp.]
MNNTAHSHLFWGSASPLAALSGGGLLIMATVRFSYAIIVSLALLWVYCFSVLIFRAAAKIFPHRGVTVCQTFLASCTAALFLLLLWIICPIMSFEMFFIVSLVPLFCVSSGIFTRVNSLDLSEALTRAWSESAVLALLILVFALIREPLGLMSLSLPGGSGGIIFIFSGHHETLFPIRLVASSSGALILLGYSVGLYRYYRTINAPRETDI